MFDFCKGSITLRRPRELISIFELRLQCSHQHDPADDAEVFCKAPELLKLNSVFGNGPILHNGDIWGSTRSL